MIKMKTFEIVMPIVGEVYGSVESETEEEALETFIEEWADTIKTRDIIKGANEYSIRQIDVLEHINKGNVCNVDTAWDVDISESK
jgi:hypothetical protein